MDDAAGVDRLHPDTLGNLDNPPGGWVDAEGAAHAVPQTVADSYYTGCHCERRQSYLGFETALD